jgi:hypothetical protein
VESWQLAAGADEGAELLVGRLSQLAAILDPVPESVLESARAVFDSYRRQSGFTASPARQPSAGVDHSVGFA